MDVKQQVVLSLTDLESYQDFLRNEENLGEKRGVYIWGFRFFDEYKKHTSRFLPYYVGKHREDIHQRLQEHFEGIREGTHRILRMDILKRVPGKYSSQAPEDHAFINTNDKKRRKDSIPVKELAELIPHINAYTDNMYVTYIDVSHLNLPKQLEIKMIDHLERYVQHAIGTERLASRQGIKYPGTFSPTIMTSNGTDHIFTHAKEMKSLFEAYAIPIKKASNCSALTLHAFPEKAEVRIAGVVTVMKIANTKKGPQMAFVTVEDATGSFELIFFPQTYSSYAHLLKEHKPLLFKGNMENPAKGIIVCKEVTSLEV